MNQALIVIGSNILPLENTRAALTLLKDKVTVVAVSHSWETLSVGAEGPNYLNTGVQFLSEFDPVQIKYQLGRPIEDQLGRVRSQNKFAPRTIDLDLIVFNGQVLDPRLWHEAYLALPLAELIPDFLHPETGLCLRQVADDIYTHIFAQIHLEV